MTRGQLADRLRFNRPSQHYPTPPPNDAFPSRGVSRVDTHLCKHMGGLVFTNVMDSPCSIERPELIGL